MSLIYQTLSFVALVVLIGGIWGWVQVVRRLRDGDPILRWQPRTAVPWGLMDLLLIVFLLMVVLSAAAAVARLDSGAAAPLDAAPQDINARQLMLMNAAYLVLFAVAVPYLLLLRNATWRDLGINWNLIGSDLVLGVKAFVLLAPIVYALQAILVQWWPSKHPLVEKLLENPEPGMLVAGGLAAVVAAPLFEEFAFRLLLQGWLENCIAFTSQNKTHGDRQLLFHWISFGPGPSGIVIAEHGEQAVSKADEFDEPINVAEEVEHSPIEAAYRAPQAESQVAAAHTYQWLSIVVSSVVFALLHYEHGPDWIPLLLLAGGLGYLYQRTHRILPCIIVHFLVNLVSFCILLVGVFDPPKL